MSMPRLPAFTLAIAGLAALAGCATLPDPLNVTLAGAEPLQGEGMEMRMLVKLRVQNPNEKEIVYTGASVKLDAQGSTFATGVSAEGGTIPRLGEAIVSVPVTASLMQMARQALSAVRGGGVPEKVSYRLSGKLLTSGSDVSFKTSGELELPKTLPGGAP